MQADWQLDILAWAKRHGRLPRGSKTVPRRERVLGGVLDRFCCKSGKWFDPAFRDRLLEKYPRRTHARSTPEETLEYIVKFAKTHGRMPSRAVPKEAALASNVSNFLHGIHVTRKARLLLKRLDACLGTGIAYRFRRSINKALGRRRLQAERRFTPGRTGR
jgi:hypothetical protein